VFLFALDPYLDVPVSRLLVFASTKENGKDTLVYFTKPIDSDTGAKAAVTLTPDRVEDREGHVVLDT
jgi:hypothetical protein